MYPPPQNGYGYQKSYENVAAAGSARNSGAWADPASSVDELQQLQLQQQQVRMEERAAAEYGFQGFGPNPNLDNGMAAPPSAAYEGSYPAAASGRHPYEKPLPDPGADAAPPATSRRIQRKAANTADNSEKRKSWFKRRFSKD